MKMYSVKRTTWGVIILSFILAGLIGLVVGIVLTKVAKAQDTTTDTTAVYPTQKVLSHTSVQPLTKAWNSGDVNGSENVDVDDVLYLLRYILEGGLAPVDPNYGRRHSTEYCSLFVCVRYIDGDSIGYYLVEKRHTYDSIELVTVYDDSTGIIWGDSL